MSSSPLPPPLSALAGFSPPLTPAAAKALAATQEREQTLTKPHKALGRLESLTEHLALWQERSKPKLERVDTIVFAGKHGICQENISAYPSEVTEQMVENFHNKGAAVNQLCLLAQSKLSIHPINFSTETRNFLHQPAMTVEECLRALQQGINAVPSRCDLLALGEMGIGNTTSAAAMLCALHEGEARQWTSSGTGLKEHSKSSSMFMRHKIDIVKKAVQRFDSRHTTTTSSTERAFAVLCELGGFELAAIVGALFKARAERIPVLLDGYPCCAAAAIALQLHPQALQNCLLAHLPQQRGARELQRKLGCGKPLLSLEMRLGEASAASLAVLVMRAALACHKGMHSFDQAGVAKAAENVKHRARDNTTQLRALPKGNGNFKS